MDRILVTGGAGFVGHALVHALSGTADTLVVDTFETGTFALLGDLHSDLVAGDVRDPHVQAVVSRFAPTAIVHLASITDTLFRDQRTMLERNVEGFRAVVGMAGASGAFLVYASSAAIYGNGPAPMHESQPRNPLNAYAFSKVCIENVAARAARELSQEMVGLRFFNVYGPGEMHKGPTASMVLQLYQQLSTGDSMRLFDAGEQQRDFIHIDDVIAAITAALETRPTGVINVGTGVARSFNDVAAVVSRCTGRAGTVTYVGPPPHGYQTLTCADTRRARDVLGFRTQYDLEHGIAAYVGWLSNHSDAALQSDREFR